MTSQGQSVLDECVLSLLRRVPVIVDSCLGFSFLLLDRSGKWFKQIDVGIWNFNINCPKLDRAYILCGFSSYLFFILIKFPLALD